MAQAAMSALHDLQQKYDRLQDRLYEYMGRKRDETPDEEVR